MANKKAITERDNEIIDEWYAEAKKVTTDTLIDFISHVMNDYIHDYGTYVHAVTACTVATTYACGKELSGFQSSIVGLQYLLHTTYEFGKVGITVRNWDNMLYPQYEHAFDKTIPKHMWNQLQEEAKRRIEDEIQHGLSERLMANDKVRAHWQSIVDGIVPFGYEIVED